MSSISKKTKFKTLDISNMKMKQLTVFFIFLFITFSALSQSKELQDADRYFNQFNFKKAIKKYKKIIDEGQHVYYSTNKIADSYRQLGQAEDAIEWYLKAIEFPDIDYEIYYKLAQELKKIKQYEDAQLYLEKYNELADDQSNDFDLSLQNHIRLLKEDSTRYEIYTLRINSEASEFGPAIFQDKLIFSSNRHRKSLVQRDDVLTDQPFFNLYQSKRNSLNELGEPEEFATKLASNLNNGPVCFNNEQTLMYVTRNVPKLKKGKATLDIYISRIQRGNWTKNVERIPLQNTGFSVAHPSLSKDGRKFYFSSNMEGGYGGMDIYVCENKNGFLSTPENLGPLINTPGNELFPFIANDGRLYFSSDGHQGLGGLDLYFALPLEDNFSYPFNMGYPINTASDDFSMTLLSDMRTGYLSSNRSGGMGGDDIYAFRIIKPLNFCLIVGNVISEADGTPLNRAQIVIKNQKGMIVNKVYSDISGNFSVYLKSDESYSFTCRKKLYQVLEGNFTEVQMLNQELLQVELSLKEK
jgi:tetratricopeptide (TPR) repeat protein